MKITGRYREGQARRQAALDYINSQPDGTALAPDIIRDLGWEYHGGSARLCRMVKIQELTREQVKYRRDNVNVSTYRYRALMLKTRDADEVTKALGRNMQKEKPPEAKPVNLGLARYVHDNHNRPAIRGQGGQGSIHSLLTATALEAMV